MKTVKESIEDIQGAQADSELRVTRRIEIGSVIQQGDLYIIRVADNHPHGGKIGSRQVAVGTNIGARHVAEGEGVEVFAGVRLPDGVSVPKWAQETGIMEIEMLGPVVVARESWTLTHPEHAHHALPAGVYAVTYQLDYSTRRRVVD